jgi:hypothetical protein
MSTASQSRMNRRIARQTWVKHFGPIPNDSVGRKCEIHHIDGNPNNNDISNLVCLTIEEHYETHLRQGDARPTALLAHRLGKTAEEITELYRLAAQKKYHSSGKKHHAYDHTLYTFINMQTREIVKSTTYDLAVEHNLDGNRLRLLITGDRVSHKGWRLLKNADVITAHDLRNPHDIVQWIHDDTGEIIEASRKQMSERYNLSLSSLGAIQKGEMLSCKGWRLVNSPPRKQESKPPGGKDMTIYRFRHTITGEIVESNRSDFAKQYDVPRSSLSRVFDGLRPTARGWTLDER